MKYPFLIPLIALTLSSGATQVYDSPGDDGTPAGVTAVPTDGTPALLNLYIDGGANESPCSDKCTGEGTGDELCAWDIRISVDGGMTIAL